jgi:maltose alpha-D-glucosyltransferase/alpha-amylase
MDTDRSALELAFTLLMTLPGSPIIYYGDEIGMGENHYLEGCAGLRTPMQWTGDRNGGFSRADWGRLYERPLVDPVYGFEALNVEQQLRTAGSFLRLLHRLIAFRQTLPALAYGNFLPLYPPNASIVAFVRGADDEVEPVLVLANLSQTPQVADLDLSPWELRIPVELFGRRAFPPIGGRLYRLTLTGRGSLLLGLSKPVSPGATEPSDIIGDQPGR